MAIYRRGKTWYIGYRDPNGSWVRKCAQTTSKREAEAIYASIMTKIREGKFFDKQVSEKVTFTELAQRVREDEIALGSRSVDTCFRGAVNRLLPFFGECFVDEINTAQVEDYRKLRLPQVSKNTINREVAILRKILNKGIRWKLAVENPCKWVKAFKVPRGRVRFLTREEQTRMLEACKQARLPYLYDMSLIAMRTGLVGQDLLGLQKKNIDFARGLIVLGRCKTGQPVEVPMLPEVRSIVERRCFGIGEDGYLFRRKDGSRYRDIHKGFEQVRIRAALKNFRFYDLRHTFATDLVSAGVGIFEVSKLLGHANVKTTQIYAHFAPEHRKAEMEK